MHPGQLFPIRHRRLDREQLIAKVQVEYAGHDCVDAPWLFGMERSSVVLGSSGRSADDQHCSRCALRAGRNTDFGSWRSFSRQSTAAQYASVGSIGKRSVNVPYSHPVETRNPE